MRATRPFRPAKPRPPSRRPRSRARHREGERQPLSNAPPPERRTTGRLRASLRSIRSRSGWRGASPRSKRRESESSSPRSSTPRRDRSESSAPRPGVAPTRTRGAPTASTTSRRSSGPEKAPVPPVEVKRKSRPRARRARASTSRGTRGAKLVGVERAASPGRPPPHPRLRNRKAWRSRSAIVTPAFLAGACGRNPSLDVPSPALRSAQEDPVELAAFRRGSAPHGRRHCAVRAASAPLQLEILDDGEEPQAHWGERASRSGGARGRRRRRCARPARRCARRRSPRRTRLRSRRGTLDSRSTRATGARSGRGPTASGRGGG